MKKTSRIVYGLTLTTLLFVGCGQSIAPDGLPKLHPVMLDLVQEGEPLVEATVSLHPLDETALWSSGGFSDRNGRAMLVTHGGYSGVPIGKYKVTVIKSIMEGTKGTLDEAGTATTFSLIDKKFTSRKTTPLEIDVQTGKNTFRLDVGTPVKNKTF